MGDATQHPYAVPVHPMIERVLAPTLGVHQWLYEHSDGRVGASLAGRPMLLLRTVGRDDPNPRAEEMDMVVGEGIVLFEIQKAATM